MKKVTYFILAIMMLSLSCRPHYQDCCIVAQPSAEMTVQKNGTTWKTFAVQGNLSEIDSLIIKATTVSASNGTAAKLDTLCFKIAYSSKGSYKLSGSQVFYGTFGQNNALTSYSLDPSYNNELVITGYQNLDNPYTTVPNEVKITGTFNIRFIDPGNTSGISFLNGNFFVIMNQP